MKKRWGTEEPGITRRGAITRIALGAALSSHLGGQTPKSKAGKLNAIVVVSIGYSAVGRRQIWKSNGGEPRHCTRMPSELRGCTPGL